MTNMRYRQKKEKTMFPFNLKIRVNSSTRVPATFSTSLMLTASLCPLLLLSLLPGSLWSGSTRSLLSLLPVLSSGVIGCSTAVLNIEHWRKLRPCGQVQQGLVLSLPVLHSDVRAGSWTSQGSRKGAAAQFSMRIGSIDSRNFWRPVNRHRIT